MLTQAGLISMTGEGVGREPHHFGDSSMPPPKPVQPPQTVDPDARAEMRNEVIHRLRVHEARNRYGLNNRK